jgi:uncharacterized protein YcbX
LDADHLFHSHAIMSDLTLDLHSLHLYPIKSCGGVTVDEALLIETGLEFDRAWMVVDEQGEFLSQRELPRMALVQPQLRHRDLLLRAPGMLALHLALDTVEQPARVRIWDEEVAAFDMGSLAAQWFSDFLGRRVRLARFDPDHQRLSSPRWTGSIEARNAFSDGYPLLITSTASLAEVNRRLQLDGHDPVTMARFRPNIVLGGLDAHGEDHLDEIRFHTPDGPVRIKLVKPCARCPIADVDPVTAEPGHAVGDALASYRSDPRLDGAITFGMNGVIVEGFDRMLRPGLPGEAPIAFG